MIPIEETILKEKIILKEEMILKEEIILKEEMILIEETITKEKAILKVTNTAIQNQKKNLEIVLINHKRDFPLMLNKLKIILKTVQKNFN